MEEFVVYVLWSRKYSKKYVGFSTNLIARFKSHNVFATKGWAKNFRPWHVVFVKFFNSKTDALSFEKYLKTGKGREWMKNNINFSR